MVACQNERTDEAQALSFRCLMQGFLFSKKKKKKRVVFACCQSLKQRVQQELKVTQVRAETLYFLPILCNAYSHHENLTPEFKGICYWIFAGIFSPTKGDGINDKLKRTQIIEFFLQLQEPSCPQKVKCKKVMLKN